MNRIIRQSRPALLAACAIAGLALASGPARAIEDDGRGNMLDAMEHLFGMGSSDDTSDIQYRERSPLVLPPKMDLPSPSAASGQRPANWPQDQEAVRARAKAAEKARRAPAERDQIMSARELKQQGRYAEGPVNEKPGPRQGCNMDPFDKSGGSGGCDPNTYWKNLDQKAAAKPDVLQAGVEPKRDYLTQPPAGYLKANQNVKATFEARKDVDEDPREYYWQQSREKAR